MKILFLIGKTVEHNREKVPTLRRRVLPVRLGSWLSNAGAIVCRPWPFVDVRIRAVGLIATVAFGLAFGPSLLGHVRYASNPLVFNDDVRQQIFPFFRYAGETVASPDLLGDYHLAMMPVGFRLLYQTLAPVMDPEPLSKVLPYVLFFVTVLGVVMAAHRIGGPIAAFMALALALQTPIFLSRMTGGLARSFAFPILSLGFWAVVAGRVNALAVLVVVAQTFYPAAAAILGLMLAVFLFILPREYRGEAEKWTCQRRLVVLLLVGALTTALFLPTTLALGPWGRTLGPSDDALYPEVGASGRYGTGALVPGLFTEARAQAGDVLHGRGSPLIAPLRRLGKAHETRVIDSLLVVLVLGLIPIALSEAGGRRSLTLPLAAALSYVLACVLAPHLYMPQRYVAYTVPLLIVVLLPASGAALARVISPMRWAVGARNVGAVLLVGGTLLLLGGRGDARTGYTVALDANTSIYEFIRSLPKDSLIAGWPSGVIDNVPYVCRRRAFVTFEAHNALHEGYILEMRRRMGALIFALLGDDRRGLMELRDNFGVTHLIVDRDHFSKPPSYFAPFDSEAKRTWRRGSERGFAVESVLSNAAVFREMNLTVLDLSKL